MKIENIGDLKSIFKEHGIPCGAWGKHSSKKGRSNLTRPLESLLNELRSGASRLVFEGGRLIRRVSIANVTPFDRVSENIWHKLVQHSRKLSNGIEKEYCREFGIMVKIGLKELPMHAAYRGLRNSLDYHGTVDLHPICSELEDGDLNSRSFPGLFCVRERHDFACVLPGASMDGKPGFIHPPDGCGWSPVRNEEVPQPLLKVSRFKLDPLMDRAIGTTFF